MPLLPAAKKLLAALPLPPRAEAEVFLSAGRSREVGWGEGSPKDVLANDESRVSVRVVEDGRAGFASGNDASPEGVRALFSCAREGAALLAPLPGRRLPGPAAAPAAFRARRDPSLFRTPARALQKRLAALEASLLASDRRLKKAVSLAFHESLGEQAVANSRGVAAASASGSVSFSLEVLGEDKGESHAAWDWSESLSWSALPVERVAASARARLLDAFGAAPLPSGAYAVVFEPRTGADVLDVAAAALSGEAALKGRSFLAGARGRAAASAAVTLVDDGRLPGGIASSAWDDEGVPSRRTVLVSRGGLKGFYYDTATAIEAGARSTGNAGRSGDGAPAPSPTNFYMAPGRVAAKALYAATPRAFVVRELLGMHTVDPASGDFSVGASGYLWEAGRPVRAVKGVTLAGTLSGLLKDIDAVAGDLTWRGATGCPTFRVKRMSVGGV